jgi:hypothetical protein
MTTVVIILIVIALYILVRIGLKLILSPKIYRR